MTGAQELEDLLADNAADLHRYLLRRLDDPEDAAEALNDVLVTAWRRRHRLPAQALEARLWLFGVAANMQRNYQRGRRRRSALVRRLIAETTAPATATATQPEPTHQRVRDAIDALPSEFAELVRLHHWEGFTLAEAAVILGVPASTARTRYAAARRRLRVALSVGGAAGDDPPASTTTAPGVAHNSVGSLTG